MWKQQRKAIPDCYSDKRLFHLEHKFRRGVGNGLMFRLISIVWGVPKRWVPNMLNVANFAPVAWWWTRNRIGQALQERYPVPKELPPELLTLVGKLNDRDWLLPSVSWENDRDLLAG
jgi:hypothetical protein